MGVQVTGCGMALPEKVVTNDELAARLGVTAEWITERTGIGSRRVSGTHETSSTLAIRACRDALARSGCHPDSVDLVIVATMTPDSPLPAVSCMVQAAIGAGNAAAFDVNAACTGFLSALSIGTALIERGAHERVLVCGADVLTKIADYTDAASCVLFGDGAGGVVLESSPNSATWPNFSLYADGAKADLLFVGRDDGLIHMKGREVYRHAVEGMVEAVVRQLDRSGTSVSDLDLVIAHQANARILAAVAERLGLPEEKVVIDIAEVGNTSAASIPIALARAEATGRLRNGSRVMLVAFGGGFTWGAGIIGWGAVNEEIPMALVGATRD